MAKQSSLIKIEGTLDDLTFYKSADGYVIRKKGGVSKDKILNDPAFARTRENGKEFGQAASSGKILRRAIIDLLSEVKDPTVTRRLTRVMTQIKNEDLISERGARNVAVGLTTPEGRAWLFGFDFNSEAPLNQVLRSDFDLDTATGEITISNLRTAKKVAYPKGATHVSFIGAFLNVDFSTGESEIELSPVQNETISNTPVTVSLTPAGVPTGTGNQLFAMYIGFYQEINGTQYQLNNGAFNTLTIIEVL